MTTLRTVTDAGGSVLEAMAEAVEKAAVVLVCLTQKYKESPNCRTGSYGTHFIIIIIIIINAGLSARWSLMLLLLSLCHEIFSR